jgi:hypothetical protein
LASVTGGSVPPGRRASRRSPLGRSRPRPRLLRTPASRDHRRR